MSWRTIVISKRCKLDLKMGYMVVRAEETKRIFLDEISVLIIESTAVSLTSSLLKELCARKIKVIFCDEKHNPHSELVPIYGCHDTSKKIREQICWTDDEKAALWTAIVSRKIYNQANLLKEADLPEQADMLVKYIEEMEINDVTNREGHAAKVYFNALFGTDFVRDFDCTINSALNYGYMILMSVFNREITANGYLTQLGLFHNNMFNRFNLSSDLMEPFRGAVDKYVYYAEYEKFEKEERYDMLNILNKSYMIDGSEQTLLNAAKIYTRSVFSAIENNDISELKFIEI